MALETMTKLQTITLSGTQAAVTFSNIPQNYTDLKIVASIRGDGTTQYAKVAFNGDTTAANYAQKQVSGNGSAASSGAFAQLLWEVNRSSYTASTFANCEAYIPNYTGTLNKLYSGDSANENNNVTAYMTFCSGIWSNPAPITSITFTIDTGANFVAGSTFYLYGIKNARRTAGNSVKATGGNVIFDGTYVSHIFTSTGAFQPTQPLTADVLVVGGGGGGMSFQSGVTWGSGGAGGYTTTQIATALTASSYTVTVGSGGAPGTGNGGAAGSSGTASSISLITASGGQGGNNGPYSQYGAGNVNAGVSNFGGIGIVSSLSGLSSKYAGGGSFGNANFGARPADDGSNYGGGLTRETGPVSAPVINTGGGGGGGQNQADGGSRVYTGQNGASGVVVIRYKA